MGRHKAYVSREFRPNTFRGETKEQEKARIGELNQLEEELAKNEYTSKLHKELLLQNGSFDKEAKILKLHMGGNLIKNKPILSRKNVAYLSSESGILLIDLKKKKKKKILTSFFIDAMFYFLDKKTKQEYLILKSFSNYIYLYLISERRFLFVKKFFIKNLFYINSFGKNGELCFATWEFDPKGKKMFMNFYLLRFAFNYEAPLGCLNGEAAQVGEQRGEQSECCPPTHVTYTFSSDSEGAFDKEVFPRELMVSSSDGEEGARGKLQARGKMQASGAQGGSRYGSQANGCGSQANGYGGQANGYGGQANGYGGQANGYRSHTDGYGSPNRRSDPVHVGAKVIIMPLVKIKYVYFSMVDMNPSLTKLVLANNNMVILYDTVKRRYSLLYFRHFISSVKISDENFLCVGFVNGFINIFLFDKVTEGEGSREDLLRCKAIVGEAEAAGEGKHPPRRRKLMSLLKRIEDAYPYVPGYEVAYHGGGAQSGEGSGVMGGELHGEVCGEPRSDLPGGGVPYIDFHLRRDKIVDVQKAHVVKYKWHSHAVYNMTIEGRKVISCGEEAVVLIYDIDSGTTEFIPHLGSPCYYTYVNRKKNLIICNSLSNVVHFISYNHRLFFYTHVGLHMPLSLRHLFWNYPTVYESIKSSVKFFEGQICSSYDYSLGGGVLSGDASTNFVANCEESEIDSEGSSSDCMESSDPGEDLEEGTTSGEQPQGSLRGSDLRSRVSEREGDPLAVPDEGIELTSSGEDEQGGANSTADGTEKGKVKAVLTFQQIQEEIERSIYNHTNVQNNLYRKYQMQFYCDSNRGLVFSFLTSFTNVQLYNVERDKHVKFVCPLEVTYKSRSCVEKVNDLELLFFAFTQSRHLLMTIERRNYQLEEASGINANALVETLYTFKIWRIMGNALDYEPVYEHAVTGGQVGEAQGRSGAGEPLNSGAKEHPPVNGAGEPLNSDEVPPPRDEGEPHLEKYKAIVSHPFLSMFLVLECGGDMTVWCLERSERIFEDSVYADYEVDVYQTQDNSYYYREVRRLNHGVSVYGGEAIRGEANEGEVNQGDPNDGDANQGDACQSVTIIKRVNHKNHPILGGDITSDGKILCICHDKLITLWDTTTLRVMAVISHAIYTGLNESLFRLYKGVEIMQMDTGKGEAKGHVPHMCFFAFDSIFIYSLHEFHLVLEKKIKNGIIEYVKFDRHNCRFVAIGVAKRLRGGSGKPGRLPPGGRPGDIIQKNYLYEFTSNVLKKRKMFYSSRDRPIVALDFAPLNERKNVSLSSFQPSTLLVALNSKFQVCTFYVNNYAEFMQLS
ncbi:hypothetical protein PVNG_02255 [Plasmodium vivax North Korean]|uniref:Uncharacterized protein n=1 Tax=Plasmodium vivax North Korean TaxID=1035514 RepID=A0A0J9WDU7_PLAVI|nr:hypothetical protein PVNG_02255 [Plasmodium vivax North Korean]